MKKINLMQIVPSLHSGGVEQGTIDLANKLSENMNLNFIVSNGGQMIKNLNKEYIKHFRLPVHSKNFFKMPFIGYRINKIIKENDINIIHVRSRAPAWLLPYINKKNIKTVSTFHNVYGNQNFLKKLYNKGLSRTDKVIAISEYVKNEIIKHYSINPSKITVINRGVDTNFYDSIIDKNLYFQDFVKKNSILNNKKIILYPGRITEWKGQLEFLKIINNLKKKSFMFYYVGDTKNIKYTKRLKQKIDQMQLSSSCKILGHLDKNDLKIMYYLSDLVISAPLRPEGFGRTISETLAMKKIILAYNFGGAKNQLNDLDNLYKVQPLNQNELQQKINIVLTSPSDDFIKIKEKGRNHIIKNFSKELMLSRYMNIYEKII